MKLVVLLCLTILIAACVSTTPSTPYLNSEPLTRYDSLSDYWLSDNKVQPIKFLTREQRRVLKGKNIELKAKYLIDSNGDVHNVEIYESNVEIPMDNLVAKALQNQDFYPSKANANKRPVYARAGLSFSCP